MIVSETGRFQAGTSIASGLTAYRAKLCSLEHKPRLSAKRWSRENGVGRVCMMFSNASACLTRRKHGVTQDLSTYSLASIAALERNH